jgi:hypothetical protein
MTTATAPAPTERSVRAAVDGAGVDSALVAEATHLRHRAESLRQQAGHLDEVLATSYRRRASELEMEAWVLEVQAGVPDSELHPAA